MAIIAVIFITAGVIFIQRAVNKNGGVIFGSNYEFFNSGKPASLCLVPVKK